MQGYFRGKRKGFVSNTCESEDKVLAFPLKANIPAFFQVLFWSAGRRIGLTCGQMVTWSMMMTKLVSVEDKVHTPVDCINICMGHECRDIQPPDGKPEDGMLQIVGWDGETISLCAESSDDCLAWKFTLQDSRTNTAYVGSEVMYDETAVASSPPSYTDYAAPTLEQA